MCNSSSPWEMLLNPDLAASAVFQDLLFTLGGAGLGAHNVLQSTAAAHLAQALSSEGLEQVRQQPPQQRQVRARAHVRNQRHQQAQRRDSLSAGFRRRAGRQASLQARPQRGAQQSCHQRLQKACHRRAVCVEQQNPCIALIQLALYWMHSCRPARSTARSSSATNTSSRLATARQPAWFGKSSSEIS